PFALLHAVGAAGHGAAGVVLRDGPGGVVLLGGSRGVRRGVRRDDPGAAARAGDGARPGAGAVRATGAVAAGVACAVAPAGCDADGSAAAGGASKCGVTGKDARRRERTCPREKIGVRRICLGEVLDLGLGQQTRLPVLVATIGGDSWCLAWTSTPFILERA